MLSSCESSFDVVVVGAGPAGCCTAAQLARLGRQVLLVDRGTSPRHGSEVLHPGARGAAADLGIADRLLGVTTRECSGLDVVAAGVRREIRFADRAPYEHGLHVDRHRLGELLRSRAAELGVTVRRGTVLDVLVDGGRVAGVRCLADRQARSTAVGAAIVVDASGRARSVGAGLTGVHRTGPGQRAVWCVVDGHRHPPGPAPLRVERRPDGARLWSAPAAGEDRAEVGCLVRVDAVDGRAAEQVLRDELRRGSLLPGGDLRLAGPVRSAPLQEQVADRVHGPGWVSVGDASAVLDPLLGGGTTLAMLTAASLAQAVDLVLRGDAPEDATMGRYAGGYRGLVADVVAHVRTVGRPDEPADADGIVGPGEPGAGLDALLCGGLGLPAPDAPVVADPPWPVAGDR